MAVVGCTAAPALDRIPLTRHALAGVSIDLPGGVSSGEPDNDVSDFYRVEVDGRATVVLSWGPLRDAAPRSESLGERLASTRFACGDRRFQLVTTSADESVAALHRRISGGITCDASTRRPAATPPMGIDLPQGWRTERADERGSSYTNGDARIELSAIDPTTTDVDSAFRELYPSASIEPLGDGALFGERTFRIDAVGVERRALVSMRTCMNDEAVLRVWTGPPDQVEAGARLLAGAECTDR